MKQMKRTNVSYGGGEGAYINKMSKKLLIITVFLVLLLIITEISYAAFDYLFIGKDNTISTSDVSLKLLESNKEIISLDNQLPISDEQGIKQINTGNVFDFSVETKTTQETNITYKLNIEKLEADEGYTNLSDEEIKIYLTDDKDNKLVGPIKISELDNYNLYEDINMHNNIDNTQIDKYRIRVWIDQDVQVKDWDANTKQQYKFKIGVASEEKQNLYVITYSPNGGVGTMKASIYDENTKSNLRKNTFTRGGYTFRGWAETKDGEVVYQDENVATNLTTKEERNKTLYAVWKPNTYTVTYNPNGGLLSLGFTSTTTNYPWIETDGVYKSGNYNINSSTSTMKSEEFTLTETGDISFDWAVSSESASYDYLYYTIYKDGTALSGTGTSTKIGGYSSSDTENNLTYKTVTKTLEAGTYYIEFTYKKDSSAHKGLDRGYVKNLIVPGYGKDETMKNSSFTVGQNNKLKQNQYKKEGYTFKGWSTKENSTNIEYQNQNDLSDIETNVKENQNINLYAVWEANKYTVNVVVNGGKVDTSSKQIEYNKNGTFNLTPSIDGTVGSVTCTNNQKGKVENNILTVSDITNNTTCTVTFKDTFTTLYEDGTLIINESIKNRNANITTHGTVTKEYEPMSDSNSYVMGENTQLWKNESSLIKSVVIGQTIQPVSTANWFYQLNYMEKGDFANLDTSQVSSMYQMFKDAGFKSTTFNLEGLSKWDTSKVTDMSHMFSYAGYNITTFNLNLLGWDTSQVTNMNYMFFDAGYNATTFNLDLSEWDTSKVTVMSDMFYNTGWNASIFELKGLSSWNTSSVTYMNDMFYSAGQYATKWSIGDLSNWNTSKVTNMNSMFRLAGSSATTWDIGNLSNWDTSSVTDMEYMFLNAGGDNATTFSLDLSGWDTSSVTNMNSMFRWAGSKATTWTVKIPKTTGSLTNTTSKWYGSSGAYAEPASGKSFTLPSIALTANVIIQEGTLASGETSTKKASVGDDVTFNIVPNDNTKSPLVTCTNNQIGTITNNVLTIKNITAATTCTVTFDSVSTVLYNDGTLIINENASNRNSNITIHGSVTKEYDAFSNSNSYVFSSETDQLWNAEAEEITNVDIGNIINPISTAYWFLGLVEVTDMDLSNLDVSNVTNMSEMFYGAGYNAKTWNVDGLSNWNTSKVMNMSSMFKSAGFNATTFNLNLLGWDTSQVTNMNYMFERAGSNAATWSVGNLSNWNTSKVTNMSYMFSSVGSSATIFDLNLSLWDTSKVTNMSGMFRDAGSSATTWTVTIPKTIGSLTNTTSKWYGSSESVYADPASGKSFTLLSSNRPGKT